jgi:hypothetical protein
MDPLLVQHVARKEHRKRGQPGIIIYCSWALTYSITNSPEQRLIPDYMPLFYSVLLLSTGSQLNVKGFQLPGLLIFKLEVGFLWYRSHSRFWIHPIVSFEKKSCFLP